MRKNQMLAKLRAGQPVAGCWMNCGSPVVAEIAAHAGFDWILLDTQHGYWDDSALLSAFQAISSTDTVPIARVLRNDPGLIGKLLDAGALGIIVPLVNSPQEAAQAVAAMRYPPEGQRSLGGSRLSFYGDDYFFTANKEIMVSMMIETREAAEHAAEILSVPGIDMGFIGPADLALSLGTFGRASAEHEALIEKVLAAGKACHVPMGIYCGSVEDAMRRAQQGFQFMPCVTDTSFISGGLCTILKQWHGR